MAHTRFLRIILGLVLVSAFGFADSYVRIVRLSDLNGDVEIDRNSGHGFEKALMNMPITQGVRLQTGSNGRAEIEFENGSVIRLAGNCAVGFTALSLRGEGQRVSEMQVGEGTVYVDYRHKGDDDFRVMMGSQSLDLNKKDVRFRVQFEGGQAQIAVLKGELQVPGTTESAKIKKNQTLRLDLNNTANYELAKNITPLGADEYNNQRTEYLELASNKTYGSPYAYGYSDLNRFGSFFSLPGYGLVWQPIGMTMNWNPYANGYWSFYPGQGYMWISGYPWGWMPYRYGNWAFAPGAGWVWVPGGWNRWNSGVMVYNPPTHWQAPTTPIQGSGGTVVVGHPMPPVRTADDALRPPRRDRLDPVGRGPLVDDGAHARTGTPVNAANPAVTAPTPAASAVHPTHPDRSADADRSAPMNKATRDYETRMQQRVTRGQPMPGMHNGAPTRSMSTTSTSAAPAASPSAPAHQAAAPPTAPAPAPAPRMSEPRMPPHKLDPNPK